MKLNPERIEKNSKELKKIRKQEKKRNRGGKYIKVKRIYRLVLPRSCYFTPSVIESPTRAPPAILALHFEPSLKRY